MGQDIYENCTLCPNNCGVNRKEKKGRCGETAAVRIAWAGLHRGEEPPVSGENGSGTVFFSGCPLHCAYCQNYQLSSDGSTLGFEITEDGLADIFLALQSAGSASLNLVTGTQFTPSIVRAVSDARKRGLKLPVVWNSSGYERVEVLRKLEDIVDLYLLDIKTLDRSVAGKFCGLKSYTDAVVPAVQYLKSLYPVTDVQSLKGVLVRHLVFPGTAWATEQFLYWFAENFKDCFQLSLMFQFVSPPGTEKFEIIPDSEYRSLVNLMDRLGIDGFIQQPDENEQSWLPDFSKDNPFPPGFAEPLDLFLKLKKRRNSDQRKESSG